MILQSITAKDNSYNWIQNTHIRLSLRQIRVVCFLSQEPKALIYKVLNYFYFFFKLGVPQLWVSSKTWPKKTSHKRPNLIRENIVNRRWQRGAQKSQSPVCSSSQEPDLVALINLYPQMDIASASTSPTSLLLRCPGPAPPSPQRGAQLWPQESVAVAALPQLVTNSSAGRGASHSIRHSKEGRDQPCSLHLGKT